MARLTCREAIRRIMEEEGGGPVSYSKLESTLKEMDKWKEQTIYQQLMALVVNLPPAHRRWPSKMERPLFLREDGRYELYSRQRHGLYELGERIA